MELSGTSGIVTGGASGLGSATARLLAEHGVRVVIADLNAVETAVGLAPLRSLVNCAGTGWAARTIGKDGEYASAHDLDLYRKVLEINLIGTFNCIRLAATA